VPLFVLVVLVTGCHPAHAQSAENVALVINDASDSSQRIGEHYIRKRAIPATNVIHIRTSVDEEVSRGVYSATIEQPIANALAKASLQDRILYIVLTKGVPLRVAGTSGLDGTVASVDSELTLLYRKMTGVTVPVSARVDNPYYLGSRLVRDAQRFTHRAYDIFLVSRLDAFTVDEAIAVIDRAQAPSSEGRIVLDQRATFGVTTGDDWLEEAARRLEAVGFGPRVVFDESSKPVRDVQSVLGYYSWGSNDAANRVRRFGMAFVPGSIAATFVSTDARTLQNPPETWMPSDNWKDRQFLFGGSPQTLVGDLVRDGATGVAGHVAEPYLQSTVRPSILFPTYVSGFNLIEAFYLAIPHLSWQTIVIGDPLCTPFPRKVLTTTDIEDPFNPDTEMPGLFGKRRLQVAQKIHTTVPESALTLALQAESRFAHGDTAGGRRALEQAVEIAPGLIPAHMQLALLYEQAGEFARAADRYRHVLNLQPNNLIALNNLAYGMATRQKQPAEAKLLALKAVAAAPNNGTLRDTLAWIEYLLGNHAEAAKQIAVAVRGAEGVAEVRLHAAFIYAETGAIAAGEYELKTALKLDPDLRKREDVRALEARLSKAAAKSRF
jgi:uncharacterized protein (TIGR03790 family)